MLICRILSRSRPYGTISTAPEAIRRDEDGAPMTPSIEYASYLVRLWREAGADQPKAAVEWHGEVEHIQSGRHWSFDTLDDTLEFLRRGAEDAEAMRSATRGRAGSAPYG